LAPPAAQAGSPLKIEAGFLSVGLSDAGRVTSLVDSRSGIDYVAAGKSVPLVSVVADGQQAVPTEVEYSSQDKVFTFRSDKASIDVKVVKFPTYSTLEVVGLDPAPGVDVQTLLWGPLPTGITQTIGETAGVVRNDAFALGLHPLNDKTVGGWPNEHLDYGFGPDLVWNPYGLQTGFKDEWLASNVAAKTTWGSVLRASTYDYSRVRIRQRTNGYEIPLGPLPAPEGRIVGSKIALFGSAPDLATSVLSEIAKGQNLPYPTINGQWQKVAQRTSQSHFWIGDLNTGNVAAASKYAKQAGIKNIYAISGNGPWKSHGHYEFNSAFGGSDENAAKLVATAAQEGIEVGVHTLSDFIDAGDPYVKAPADPRLAVGGSAKLTRPLGETATTLYVDADGPLRSGVDGQRLRIGDEFVTYGTVAKVSDSEWQVSGVASGAVGFRHEVLPGRHQRRPAHPERLRRRDRWSADHRRDRHPARHRVQQHRHPGHVVRRVGIGGLHRLGWLRLRPSGQWRLPAARFPEHHHRMQQPRVQYLGCPVPGQLGRDRRYGLRPDQAQQHLLPRQLPARDDGPARALR